MRRLGRMLSFCLAWVFACQSCGFAAELDAEGMERFRLLQRIQVQAKEDYQILLARVDELLGPSYRRQRKVLAAEIALGLTAFTASSMYYLQKRSNLLYRQLTMEKPDMASRVNWMFDERLPYNVRPVRPKTLSYADKELASLPKYTGSAIDRAVYRQTMRFSAKQMLLGAGVVGGGALLIYWMNKPEQGRDVSARILFNWDLFLNAGDKELQEIAADPKASEICAQLAGGLKRASELSDKEIKEFEKSVWNVRSAEKDMRSMVDKVWTY